MTDLRLSGVFFQPSDTPKLVCGGAQPRTPLGELTTLRSTRPPSRLWKRAFLAIPFPVRLHLGASVPLPAQIPGYAYDSVRVTSDSE